MKIKKVNKKNLKLKLISLEYRILKGQINIELREDLEFDLIPDK